MTTTGSYAQEGVIPRYFVKQIVVYIHLHFCKLGHTFISTFQLHFNFEAPGGVETKHPRFQRPTQFSSAVTDNDGRFILMGRYILRKPRLFV